MWHERPGTILVEPGDRAFWQGLWKSDVFRALLDDPAQPYGALLERAIEQPWWFVDAHHDYERRHFSIWFGQVFLRREYENPVITDLYYWHDLVHALTFRRLDDPSLTEADWRRAMRANEIAVSIETEMLIYARCPALRAQSFQERIWMDDLEASRDPLSTQDYDRRVGRTHRLLAYHHRLDFDPGFAATELALRQAVLDPWPLPHPAWAGHDPGCAAQWFWDMRRAVTLDPDPDNAVEVALRRYEDQAQPYYNKWANDWRRVELDRARFQQLVAEGNWRKAVAERHAHWTRVADDNGVPYGTLAPRPKKKAS